MSQRIAYVTGGMGGIGTAICQRLSKKGHLVIAGCGPNSPRRERWLGEKTSAITLLLPKAMCLTGHRL
jgi:acetoacetyl-CoA reductase